MGESLSGVAAIAEGFIFGESAAAEADSGAAGKAEDAAGGVDDFEIAFDTNGAVTETGDFGCRHLPDGSITLGGVRFRSGIIAGTPAAASR